jgi:fatty acid desaturase
MDDPLVRVLDVIFWIVVAMLVGALIFLGQPGVDAMLMALLVLCSGVLALYEFRLSPMAQTERGQWSGRQLFYGSVFTISVVVAFIFILTLIF